MHLFELTSRKKYCFDDCVRCAVPATGLQTLRMGVLCGLLLWLFAESYALASETPAPVKVLIYGQMESCADTDTIRGVLAEVDDLPVEFEIRFFHADENEVTTEHIRAEMTTSGAGAAFWFSCSSNTVNMTSTLAQLSESHRIIGRDETGLSLEALNAVIRSWLEALLPLLQKKLEQDHLKKEAERAAVSEPPIVVEIDNEELPPGQNVSPRNALLAESWPKVINVSAGSEMTMIAPKVFLPGAYVSLAFRSDRKFVVFLSAAKLATADFQMNEVKLELRKHPVVMGVIWLLPRRWGVWDVGFGFEVDIYERTVFIEGEFDSRKISAQSAIFIRSGISLHLFSTVCLVFHIGARLLTTEPVYEIAVEGQRRILHDPWLIQPIAAVGIRIGIF